MERSDMDRSPTWRDDVPRRRGTAGRRDQSPLSRRRRQPQTVGRRGLAEPLLPAAGGSFGSPGRFALPVWMLPYRASDFALPILARLLWLVGSRFVA